MQIKRYYSFKRKHPEFMKDLVPSNDYAAFTSGTVIMLPLRSTEGERIMLYHIGHRWKPNEVSLHQMFRAIILTFKLILNEPKTQVF